MGYESLSTTPRIPESASEASTDAAKYVLSRDFSHLNGSPILDWKMTPFVSGVSDQFDGKMRRIFKEATILGHKTGVYAGRLADGTAAYKWMVERWAELDSEALDTIPFRDWLGKQFAPFSTVPNPYSLTEMWPDEKRRPAQLDTFIHKAIFAIESGLNMTGTIESTENNDEASDPFPISDGWLLNVTASDFFRLIEENWPTSNLEEDDLASEKEMLMYFENLHSFNTSMQSKTPAETMRGQLSNGIANVTQAANQLVDETQGGTALDYIKRKKKDLIAFRNFQNASNDAAGFNNLIIGEQVVDEKVDPVVEESLWEQIGRHYELDNTVVRLLREHPEARSAIKNSIKLAPLYLGQRTLVGWPAWAGLVAIFEGTPALREIIHSDYSNLAVLGAGVITYAGAKIKSLAHKEAIESTIGSADLIATLAQINSIATEPHLSPSEHAKNAVNKAKRADLIWISWPLALYGAYKLGHATEYLLSANINFAIESAMIRFHARNKKNQSKQMR